MTVLPTVRRQIEQAAAEQTSTRHRQVRAPLPSAGAESDRPAPMRLRPRLTGGGAVAAIGVAVALCITVAAVVLLGHKRMNAKSPAAALAAQYPLTANGIGAVGFGASPQRVVAGLDRLLGRPEGAGTGQRPNGLVPSICGFDYEIDWVGLPEKATARRYTHSAGLTVYFRHSRFAGYSYGPPWGDRATPVVRHGVMLHTSKGLDLDDQLARAQRLYGPAFTMTTKPQGTPPNPKLERLPAWQIRTPTGLIYGYIDSPHGPSSSDNRTIGSISAGSTPNTPCRARPTGADTR